MLQGAHGIISPAAFGIRVKKHFNNLALLALGYSDLLSGLLNFASITNFWVKIKKL